MLDVDTVSDNLDAQEMTEPITIGLATHADLPRILEISNWAAEHTIANFAIEPESLVQWSASFTSTRLEYPWLVARFDGNVIGFAKASPHKTRGAYAWAADVAVYLAPEHHGRGLGAKLYGTLLPLMKAQRYVTAIAGITDGHEASERLHARLGFARCGTFHRVGFKFGKWLDVGYWELSLQSAEYEPKTIRPVADVWIEEMNR